MTSRIFKIPSVQSGPFDSVNSRLSFKVETDPSSSYIMDDSYLLMNVEPTTRGTDPAGYVPGNNPPIYSQSFGTLGGASYHPAVMIKNARLNSSTKGNLESNNDINLLRQSMFFYENDREMRTTLVKDGYSDEGDESNDNYQLPFVNQQKVGNVMSTVKSADVRIPLKYLYQLGDYDLPQKKVGDLEFHLELEGSRPLFGYTDNLAGGNVAYDCEDVVVDTGADANSDRRVTITQQFINGALSPYRIGQTVLVKWTVGGFTKQGIRKVREIHFAGNLFSYILEAVQGAGDAIYANGDNVTNVSIEVFSDLSNTSERRTVLGVKSLQNTNNVIVWKHCESETDHPFYVGQLVRLSVGVDNGDIANIDRMITAIAFANNEITLTVDGVAMLGTNDDYVGTIRALKGAASLSQLKINRAELVMVTDKVTSTGNIEYEKLMVEPINKPDQSTFERVYTLDRGTRRIAFVNNTQDVLASLNPNLGSYRMYYDNKSNTDTPVGFRSPLYYDRLLRFFGPFCNDLEEIQDLSESIVVDLVNTDNPEPQLLLQLNATAGNTLGDSILYLWKYVETTI